MKRKIKVHCLVFEGFSDWEPAFVLPELRNNSVEVISVGFSKSEVTSKGGLRILPDEDIFKTSFSDIETLIIPGGSFWEEETPEEFILLVKKLHSEERLIAAICGATILLAKAGLLDSCRHTSNQLEYLKNMAPSYKGESQYISSELAVSSQNLITASGLGAIEFAKEILATLGVLSEEKATAWFNLFKYAKF